jgi:hypothetical protein
MTEKKDLTRMWTNDPMWVQYANKELTPIVTSWHWITLLKENIKNTW